MRVLIDRYIELVSSYLVRVFDAVRRHLASGLVPREADSLARCMGRHSAQFVRSSKTTRCDLQRSAIITLFVHNER